MIRRSSLLRTLPVLILVVTQLHLLRNLSPLYILIYSISFLLAILFTVHRWHLIRNAEKSLAFFIILIFITPLFSIIPGIFDSKYHSLSDVATGISRIFFTLPIYLAVIASPSNRRSIKDLLIVTALITLVAALSIPYQFIFGPIAWFAAESERSGLARYASLFGSLTALGIVCGYGVLSAVITIKSAFWLAAIITGIVLGSLLSLQKAAIANLVLCIVMIPFIKKVEFRKSTLLSFLALLTLMLAVISVSFGDEMKGYLTSLKLFSSSESSFSDDVSFFDSLVERATELPAAAIEYHGIRSLLLGLGPVGGSGSFGYPEVPMSHNGLVDLLLIGGIAYFVIFCMFALFSIASARPNKHVEAEDIQIRNFGLFCFCMLLINMPFSGLLFFSPSNAMFFAVSLKCMFLVSTATNTDTTVHNKHRHV